MKHRSNEEKLSILKQFDAMRAEGHSIHVVAKKLKVAQSLIPLWRRKLSNSPNTTVINHTVEPKKTYKKKPATGDVWMIKGKPSDIASILNQMSN